MGDVDALAEIAARRIAVTTGDWLDRRTVAVCIATCNRTAAMADALETLSKQDLVPGAILVVDASDDDGTRILCEAVGDLFPAGVLRYERSAKGLPLQRRRGIARLRDDGVRYICMMDDDVTLAPDFLSKIVTFMDSDEGEAYGGVSGYSMIGWGVPFERLERLYASLGIYDGDLRAGRWLYCGALLLLSRLAPFAGIRDADYIAGTHAVWRTEVFDRYLPPAELGGYALWEDVHLSLRVGTSYRLGVLGDAHAWHHRAAGGRPGKARIGFQSLRRQALVLRDCDPTPTRRRYVAFLAFSLLDVVARSVWSVVRLRPSVLPHQVGSVLGWLTCVLRPPRPTGDALHKAGSARSRSRGVQEPLR